MKKAIFYKCLLIATLAITANANAASYTLGAGSLSVPSSTPFNAAVAATGSFTDTWSFSTALPANADNFVSSAFVNLPVFSSGITLSSVLLDGVTPSTINLVGDSNAGTYVAFFNNIALTPGGHTLDVSGNSLGGPLASYNGNLTLGTPVPELEEWAMLLLGLGLIGMRVVNSRQGSQTSGMPIYA